MTNILSNTVISNKDDLYYFIYLYTVISNRNDLYLYSIYQKEMTFFTFHFMYLVDVDDYS